MKDPKMSVFAQRCKYVVSDLLTTAVAFFLFNIFRYHEIVNRFSGITLEDYLLSDKLLIEQTALPIALISIYWLSGYYNQPFHRSRLKELMTTAFSCLVNTFLIYFGMLTNDSLTSRMSTAGTLMVLFILMMAFVYAGRLTITSNTIEKLRKHRWYFNTVIIGNSREAHRTAFNLAHSNTPLGYRIVGHVSVDGERDMKDKEGIRMEDLPEFCRLHDINELIIVLQQKNDEKTLQLLGQLYPLGISIRIAPDNLTFVTSGIHMQDIYAEPFVDVTSPRISEASKNIKRVFDVVLSSLALVVVSPIMLGLAIAIRRESKGPVFYRQTRLGYMQRPFEIIKFRSMRIDAEADGPRLSTDDDPRITSIGKTMRKYRLDELPQFWNVIRGEMSLVGPRPEREYFIRQIVDKAPYYTILHQVKPGITSWGMVKYGYASNVDEMVERMRYDLIYLSNMSILVDLKILIHTVKTVVTGKGV